VESNAIGSPTDFRRHRSMICWTFPCIQEQELRYLRDVAAVKDTSDVMQAMPLLKWQGTVYIPDQAGRTLRRSRLLNEVRQNIGRFHQSFTKKE